MRLTLISSSALSHTEEYSIGFGNRSLYRWFVNGHHSATPIDSVIRKSRRVCEAKAALNTTKLRAFHYLNKMIVTRPIKSGNGME